MKKKPLCLLLMMTMIATLSCIALAEEDGARIVISMDSVPAQVGDTITVKIGLEDVTAKQYLASDVVLYFNPTVLQCTAEPTMSKILTESGVMTQIYKNIDAKKGLARCAIGMLPERFSESGFQLSEGKLELFSVTFEVIGQGDLNLQIAERNVSPAFVPNAEDGAELYLGNALKAASFSHEKISHVIGEKGDALVSEILPIDAITVPYGTEEIAHYLPNTVSVKLDDGSVKEFGMSWTGFMSSYDGSTPGTYLFRGTLQEEEGYNNHLGLFSLLEVTVSPKEDAKETIGEEPSESEEVVKPESTFTDLDSVPWAKDIIIALATEGIVSGESDEIYLPDGHVTRAQFVAMLTRAFHLLDETTVSDFSDVPPGEWYYTAVASAKKCGITAGYEDNTFRPDALITRQEMAAMAYRTAHIAKVTIPDSTDKLIFTDEDQISDYAKDAIRTMQQGGVINGMGDGRFGPEENATRAQAAVVIYQLYQFK